MTAIEPARDAKGRMVKGGGSLNPAGRPRVPEVLKSFDEENSKKLVAIAKGELVDDKVSPGQASMFIYDRLHAKPVAESGNNDDKLSLFFAGMMARLGDARSIAAADEAEDGDE